ncbi:hypothetical protein [uncultured Lamprocystis sp.]|jgi:hypothetical protein|uniref:hypothetical protein n=1 Tax=uncultured Lamprocystis sp. TaxID=543132 RepID=UPI0025E65492|nr:hypothetical protein [uncultured Lamprocystis sp.]
MTRRASIGFDRRIDLDWLDAAAAQAAAGAPPEAMRTHLSNLLNDVLKGDTARGKTVTVLSHIWGAVPEDAAALHGRASAELCRCTPEERLALHWAMMLGTYPIFSDVTAAAGRLLMLQGQFTLAHLTRRLVDAWGERSTLERAVQRIVRSMIQWEALRDTATRGMYEKATVHRKVGPAVSKVLIEALLLDAEETSIPFAQLVGHPALFPFDLDLSAGQIRDAPHFRVHRQGLDSDVVEVGPK